MRWNAVPAPLALAIVLCVALVTVVYRVRHDAGIWTSDSAVYLRMALADRGLTESEAKRDADAFMAQTAEGRLPESAGFYGPNPPTYYAQQFGIFRTRPLYPLLTAALYPAFGPHAMQLISAAAYVLGTAVMFGILSLSVPAATAGLGALAFATAPQVLALCALPLTDEMALLFWCCALGAMLRYVRAPGALSAGGLAAAALLLTFTRPAAYLPCAAACGYAIAVRGELARRAAAALLTVTFSAGIIFTAYTAIVHGPGPAAQLRWQYDWQRAVHGPGASGSFGHWYAFALAAALGLLLTVGVYKYAALVPLALAAYGARIAQRDDLALLLGGAAGALAAIGANPLEINRTALLPLTPTVVVLATLALDRLFRLPVPVAARGPQR
ncbi:MAG: hypothetical protein JOZ24_00775 [Candidatus Eremiobacteraeota bacterium]|nr:hypothetical protein [Candidatus Eremiobacteraeota bacterium]